MIATLYEVVPAWLRLTIALVLFVGFSLLAVKVFHLKMLMMASKDGRTLPDDYAPAEQKAEAEAADAKQEADSSESKKNKVFPPEATYLAGRVLQITGLGFVFLMAFSLSNFWGNSQAALSAMQDEQMHYHRAITIAEQFPADQGGAQLVAALQTYAAAVSGPEWDAMRMADAPAAMQVHDDASRTLATTVHQLSTEGLSKADGWGELSGSIDDMLSSAVDRINQLPGRSAPTILIVVFVLAVTNLALTIAFQPTRLPVNLFLVGVMAAVTAFLLFFVTEAANPFNGGNALMPPNWG